MAQNPVPATSPGTVGARPPVESPQMGTWQLNEAKSNIPPGVQRNTTVIHEPQGDMIRSITKATSPDGKPVRMEWVGKFDGKEYPVTGDANADRRAYTLEDERTLFIQNSKNGKPTTKGRVIISPDGRSRTIEVSGTDTEGRFAGYTAVYDKQ